jgi:signal transduction histidine kinase
VTSLNRNAELLARLVEDLRVLSLADAGRLELRRRNVDLTALAAAVLDDYQTRLTSQQVAGELQAPQQRVLAFVDPDRLTQVLGNLIDNALRVTGEGGRVTVTLAVEGSNVRLSVRDTGPGLSDEAAARTFDRYFQGKDVDYAAPPVGSSGLGLAIVRTLVEMHGGAVSVANVDDPPGAEFTAVMPLERPT